MKPDAPGTGSNGSSGNAEKAAVQVTFLKWAVFLLMGSVWFAIWLVSYATTPAPRTLNQKIEVTIPRETGFNGIRKILVENGVIEDSIRFTLLASLLGALHRLKAGEYLFQPGQSPYQVLVMLQQGKAIQRAVTIPEGLNLRQVAEIWARDGWVDRDKFLALTVDQTLIRELGLDLDSLEGYLFPDTYFLAKDSLNEKAIIRMMVNRFMEVYAVLLADIDSESFLSRHEILTLASIVEKETAQPQERPLVARVFLNRLRKNMRLQSDPTVIYGRSDFSGNLTRLDLETPSLYNTYVIKGLPPGPIANPGRAAIEAVLRPAKGDYFYFVSRNDGTHYFSKTLAEHNRAVEKYQK